MLNFLSLQTIESDIALFFFASVENILYTLYNIAWSMWQSILYIAVGNRGYVQVPTSVPDIIL